MPRKASVLLWRAIPPRARKVTVECLTVRRIMAAIDAAAGTQAVLFQAIKNDSAFTLAAFADVLARDPARLGVLAEIACPDERQGFYNRFATQANNWRLLEAIADTNDWGRIASLIGKPGAPKASPRRGASIYACADAVAIRYGMTPPGVLDMYVDDFVDLLQGMRETEARADPLSDDTVTADDISGIPGFSS